MTAIKDLVDLFTQLNASISDRKTRDMFLPLKEKFAEAKLEHFESERQHSEETERLKTDHLQTVANLESEHRNAMAYAESRHQSEIANLEAQHQREMGDLETRYRVTVADLRKQIPVVHDLILSDEHKQVLSVLATHDMTADQISQCIGLDLLITRHHLDELQEHHYVSCCKQNRRRLDELAAGIKHPDLWTIAQRGRTYVIDHNLQRSPPV